MLQIGKKYKNQNGQWMLVVAETPTGYQLRDADDKLGLISVFVDNAGKWIPGKRSSNDLDLSLALDADAEVPAEEPAVEPEAAQVAPEQIEAESAQAAAVVEAMTGVAPEASVEEDQGPMMSKEEHDALVAAEQEEAKEPVMVAQPKKGKGAKKKNK